MKMITGMTAMTEDLSPKVLALFEAVGELMMEGVNVNEIKVADITSRAGIGKGTAYAYFTNKEEIISSAILYQISRICTQTVEKIKEMDSIGEMLIFIMDCMDREIQNRDCLLRFVHLLSDTGSVSQVLKDKAKEQSGKVCMPENLVMEVVQAGLKTGEISCGLPPSYIQLTITAKIFAYIFYVNDNFMQKEFTRQEIKAMICESLLKELG